MSLTDSHNEAENGGGGNRTRESSPTDPLEPNIATNVAVAAVIEARERGGEETSIYFIQAADGPVKIGTADDVQKRRAMLQCGNPHRLRVISVFRGPSALERVLHQWFAEYRMCGEWFEPHPEVLAVAAYFRDFSLFRPEFTWDDSKTWDDLREAAGKPRLRDSNRRRA